VGTKLSIYHKIWTNLTANIGFTGKSAYCWVHFVSKAQSFLFTIKYGRTWLRILALQESLHIVGFISYLNTSGRNLLE